MAKRSRPTIIIAIVLAVLGTAAALIRLAYWGSKVRGRVLGYSRKVGGDPDEP